MLDPTALMWACYDMPHGPLKLARNLPALPGVYIVYQHQDVLYIGTTKNLQKRWATHARRYQLAMFGNDVEIAWQPMPESDVQTRTLTEQSLIALFHPRLNGNHGPMQYVRRVPKRRSASDVNRDAVGIRIAAKREALGITMTELALRAHMDLTKLSRLERGHLKTRIEDLQRLTVALGCKVTELIEDAVTPPIVI